MKAPTHRDLLTRNAGWGRPAPHRVTAMCSNSDDRGREDPRPIVPGIARILDRVDSGRVPAQRPAESDRRRPDRRPVATIAWSARSASWPVRYATTGCAPDRGRAAGGVALGPPRQGLARYSRRIEHMGRHPMGEQVDPTRGFVSEKIVDESALHGDDAENLHDRGWGPATSKGARRPLRPGSPAKVAAAIRRGKIQPPWSDGDPHRRTRLGRATRRAATAETTLEGLAALKTRSARTAGSPRQFLRINDGATGCLIAQRRRERACLRPRCGWWTSSCRSRARGHGLGPVPATRSCAPGSALDGRHRPHRDQRAFGVQVLAFLATSRSPTTTPGNPWGGASPSPPTRLLRGRLIDPARRAVRWAPEVRYGLTP